MCERATWKRKGPVQAKGPIKMKEPTEVNGPTEVNFKHRWLASLANLSPALTLSKIMASPLNAVQ